MEPKVKLDYRMVRRKGKWVKRNLALDRAAARRAKADAEAQAKAEAETPIFDKIKDMFG